MPAANLWKLDLTRPGSAPEDAHLAPSTLDELSPSYSPDGSRIVFASTRSGSEELWIANGDGTNPRQVGLGMQVGSYVYIPDDHPPPFASFYLLHGLSDDYTSWLRRTTRCT